mgnify:CR=1 FL=1
MPKERISDESGILAQVVWSHDQYVQVATLSSKPKEFVAWCKEIAERGPETTNPHGIESMGMFWSPNRYQINELIRVLRRARDQAFGRDE